MSKKKANNCDVIIYTSSGDHLSAEIEQLAKKDHAKDWKIADIRDVMDNDKILDEIENAGIRRFPIVCVNGRYMSFGEDIDPIVIVKQIEKETLGI